LPFSFALKSYFGKKVRKTLNYQMAMPFYLIDWYVSHFLSGVCRDTGPSEVAFYSVCRGWREPATLKNIGLRTRSHIHATGGRQLRCCLIETGTINPELCFDNGDATLPIRARPDRG
jgi:hypothetical protein